jgi:hypothetical protein
MEIAIIPKALFTALKIRVEDQFNLNVFFTALLIVVVPFALPSILESVSIVPHVCLFKLLFGIRCPGCGFVRGFIALSHMHLRSAWSFNPFAVLIYFLSIAQLFLRTSALAFPQTQSSVSAVSRRTSTVLATLLIFWWIHQLFVEY